MSFGKKGQPAEDMLTRRREFYKAVSPLILQTGARQLSMRQAVSVACLSNGYMSRAGQGLWNEQEEAIG